MGRPARGGILLGSARDHRAGDLAVALIREQMRNSYLLVVRRSVTPRSLREEILRHVEEHGLPE